VSENSGENCLDPYPGRIVTISIVQTFVSYALGAAVLYLVGPGYALVFILLVAVNMIMSPLFRCRFCYYHGKLCSFGMGIIAGLLTGKGSGEGFVKPENVYPVAVMGILTTAVPLIALAYLLVTGFTPAIGVAAVLYLLIAMAPGFYLRPRVFCNHCVQGRMGCPAYDRMKKGENISGRDEAMNTCS